eukprot:scaffold172485_cov15-Tisochrysis_lutea.AAC.1
MSARAPRPVNEDARADNSAGAYVNQAEFNCIRNAVDFNIAQDGCYLHRWVRRGHPSARSWVGLVVSQGYSIGHHCENNAGYQSDDAMC